jgi:hypothetical protein
MSELLGPEAVLRRALHAAAEQVDPGDDGLDRIRARVSHRRPMPFPVAWVDVALTRLSLRVPDGFWVVWDRVASEVRAVTDQFLPARLRSERLRLGWLRPVAAMSVAVFIVAAVVSMAIEVPQVISPAGSEATQSRNLGTQQQTGGNGGPGGQTQTQQGSNPSGNPASSAGGPNSSVCPSKPTPRHSITSAPASPSTSPTQSASPTPSDTSPSTSASPTPTPSDSLSNAPSGSDSSPSTAGAPGTGLAAGSASDANAANNTIATGNNPPRTTRTKSRTSPSPCPSAKPSPTSTVQVHPDAEGAVPWAQSEALSPAEHRARVG